MQTLVSQAISQGGARQFRAIRSYLSAAAKHGLGFFNALVMLTEGRPAPG